jgi:hypothetical protein
MYDVLIAGLQPLLQLTEVLKAVQPGLPAR